MDIPMPLEERRKILDAEWKKDIEHRMFTMEEMIRDNTLVTYDMQKVVNEIKEILNTVKGFFKFIGKTTNFFSLTARKLIPIFILIGLVVGFFIAVRHGKVLEFFQNVKGGE